MTPYTAAPPDTYLADSQPVPVRFASRIQRGPSPPDPLQKQEEPEETPVGSARDDDTRDRIPKPLAPPGILPATILPDISVEDLLSLTEEAAEENQHNEVRQPRRRLLLETRMPRATLDERLPSFEFPIGTDGASLRLPLVPASGGSTVLPPQGSATYRRDSDE